MNTKCFKLLCTVRELSQLSQEHAQAPLQGPLSFFVPLGFTCLVLGKVLVHPGLGLDHCLLSKSHLPVSPQLGDNVRFVHRNDLRSREIIIRVHVEGGHLNNLANVSVTR